MKLTDDGKRYVNGDGALYDRVSSLCKMADYCQDGLVFAGASMVAKRVPEIVRCAISGEPYSRPSVVMGEPAVTAQDVSDWPDMVRWLSVSPSAELEKARNRGNIIDALAITMAKTGGLSVSDAGEWAVQYGIDMMMSFDQDSVRNRAHCLAAWWNSVDIRPIAWQVMVYDDELMLCGTLDMLARIGEENYLLDWKAGVYSPTYKMQVSAYRMFANVYHEDPNTAAAILEFKQSCIPALVCIGDNRVQFRPVNNVMKWKSALTTPLNMYRGLTEPEDSPVSTALSHTMTVFDLAEAQR